jgi:hypothetical protein
MVVEGQSIRFCQQCGRFQLLDEFDGDRRSCRRKLEKHNERRRRNEGLSDTESLGDGSGMMRLNGRATRSKGLHDYDAQYGALADPLAAMLRSLAAGPAMQHLDISAAIAGAGAGTWPQPPLQGPLSCAELFCLIVHANARLTLR